MSTYVTTHEINRGGAWGITLIGVTLGCAAVAYGVSIGRTSNSILYPALDFLLLLAMAGTVAGSGYWLGKSDVEGPELWQIATWVGLGVIVMGVLTAWQLLAQARQGVALQQPLVVVAFTQTVGAVAGLLVGVYHVRAVRKARVVRDAREDARQARAEAESARDAEDQLRFLNHLLRHHLFNGIQVIRSNAEFLGEYVDDDGHSHVETIRRRSDRLVRLVENMRVLVQSLSEERTLGTVDLVDALEREIEVVKQTYGSDVFETEGVEGEVFVTADTLLPTVFENLLRSTVEHSANHVPEIEISLETTEETAVVTIQSRGSALADGIERHFAESADITETASEESTDFYVSRRLVSNYGGDIDVTEPAEGTATIRVELPLADASSGSTEGDSANAGA
jgi:two-component system OmpR family sensor kinase